MRRLLAVLAALTLVAAACGDDTSALIPSATNSPLTTAPAENTEAPATPTAPAVTSSTTPASTTIAEPGVVTAHPSLPGGVLGRDSIPWAEVGEGWVLALYSGDRVHGEFSDGPTVLYLASPGANVYEITSWPAGSQEPHRIMDWSPDGRRALLQGLGPPPDRDLHLVLVDLASGSRSTALTLPGTVRQISAGFTMPTGTDLVVATDDGTTERLEVHRSSGDNTVLIDNPSVEAIDWLHGQAGTSVVVSDVDGMRLLDNRGNVIHMLDTRGTECRMPRWWDSHTLLATCVPYAQRAAGYYHSQLGTSDFSGG